VQDHRAVMEVALLLLEEEAQSSLHEVKDIKSPLDIGVVETDKNVCELSDIHLCDVFFEIWFHRG